MLSSFLRDRVTRQSRAATYNSTGRSETWTTQEELWASVLIVNRSRSVDYQQTFSTQKIYKVTLRGRFTTPFDIKNTRFLWKGKQLEPYLAEYDSSISDTDYVIYYCHQVDGI